MNLMDLGFKKFVVRSCLTNLILASQRVLGKQSA